MEQETVLSKKKVVPHETKTSSLWNKNKFFMKQEFVLSRISINSTWNKKWFYIEQKTKTLKFNY